MHNLTCVPLTRAGVKSDVGKTELKEPTPHRLADFSVLLLASLTSKHVLGSTLKDIVTLLPLMVALVSVIVGGAVQPDSE